MSYLAFEPDFHYTLEHPIQKGERRVESLRLATLRIRHLKAAESEQDEISYALALLSSLSGEPVALLEELRMEDYHALLAYLERCNPKKPPTPSLSPD